jgi:pyruvate,water dikinase
MLTEDQFDEVVELESYKKNFFKYWDKFGAKYNDQMLKLFGLSRGTIPSSLVSRWLREYLGTSSKEILTNFFNKTVHKIDNCGGYDFTFTIDNYRRDGHQFEITITVDDISSSVGNVYDGKAEWDEKEVSISEIPETETLVKLILADPDQAFQLSFYPNSGIGLLRLEFIISNKIRIHPMALIHMDHLRDFRVKKQIEKLIDGYSSGKEFFIDQLALNVAKIAAAFYPKPVTVRLSDFKTDEYAGLIGGSEFEMKEENPMIGFRGASRYYHKNYREGFELECAALKKVRDDMGLTNVQLMVPFCRTIKEADEVIHLFEKQGLKRGERLLKILMMCEIPSNIILAEEFAKRFDGFSIGSNDLTQLILGVDRGNPLLSELFNENDPAVRSVIEEVIRKAIRKKIEIGFCGQIPSDDPNFAEFLVDAGINSISFNPDAVIKGILNIAKAEKHFKTNKNE